MSKISVIVPVHNTEEYLEKCVRSILVQTFSDLQIILVENGSTDGSLELCRKLESGDSRIMTLHLDVGDLSTARNYGLLFATSEYVAFIDSDDTIHPEMYETLYRIAERNDLDLICCNHILVYDNRPSKSRYINDGKIGIISPKEMLRMNFRHEIPLHACTFIARKSLFDNIRFPEKMYFEDRATTYRLINASEKVGYIREPFYRYYQRANSIVHSMSWKKYYDYALTDTYRLRFLRDSKLFSKAEQQLLAEKSSDSLLRRIRRMHMKAKTDDQKRLTRDFYRHIQLIPEGCHLSIKAKIIRRFIRAFYI